LSDFSSMGKWLALMGAGLLILGGLIWLAGRLPFLGNLPGDIRLQRENMSCYFPLATMLILSLVLTVILNILLRLLRK